MNLTILSFVIVILLNHHQHLMFECVLRSANYEVSKFKNTLNTQSQKMLKYRS